MTLRPLILAFGLLLLGGLAPQVLAQEAKPITASDSWDIPIKFTSAELREIYQLNQAFLKLTPAAGTGPRRGAKAGAIPQSVDAKTFLFTLTRIALKAQSRDAKARVKPGFLAKLEEVKDKVTLTPQQEQQAQEIAKTAAQKFKEALAASRAGAKLGAGRGQRSARSGGQVQGLLPYMEQSNFIANQETYAAYKLIDVIVSSYS